jgi:tape measure domain-containing protein
MAVSNVELRVDARQAIQALQQVNNASGRASSSTQQLTQAVNGTNSALGRTRANAGQAASSLVGLANSVAKVAAAYGALRIAQQAVDVGIQREESSRRLTFLAKGYNEVAQAQEAAARTGRQFGLSATESNQQFAQLYGRLRPLNVSLQDIESAFVGFNTAAKVSGTTTAESAGALLQLTQALGSGVLRGQELNSVLEQAPGLVVALTKELNAPVSQIRELAEEGKITSDVVIRALQRAATDGAGQLEAAMQGPAQQVKNLQNAFEEFQVAISEALMPVVIESIKALTRSLQDGSQNIRDVALAFEFMAGKLAPLLNGLEQLQWYFANLTPPGWAMQVVRGATNLGTSIIRGGANRQRAMNDRFGRYIPGSEQVDFMQRNNQTLRTTTAPTGTTAAKGKAAREAERAAEAARREADRVAEVIRSRLAEGQITRLNSELKDRIAAAEMKGDKMQVARLQSQQRELDLQYRYAQELAKETNVRAQQAIIFAAQNDFVANQRDMQRELAKEENESAKAQIAALESIIGLQNTLTDQQKQQQVLADGIANTVGEGMTSAFNALIQGSEDFGSSLRRIASGVLIDIANQLLQVFVIQKAINAISGLFGGGGGGIGGFSYAGVSGSALSSSMISGGFTSVPFSTVGLGFRANGGSVRSGQPYIVGERGPELFMPGRSGGIAPTGSFGGGANVVVNVDASGSNVQGDGAQAKALGAVIGAAVQAELVKQKRPGGLLY